MSGFIQPESDRSEPGLVEFLYLWEGLPGWQRAQVLSAMGVDRAARFPVSELLTKFSAAELLVRVRRIVSPDSGVAATEGPRSSKRHITLEWPPRGPLADIQRDLHDDLES